MNAAHSPANSALFGNEEYLSVSRALSELQARRPIRVNAPGEVLFALPVEGLDDQRLHEFAVLCGPNAPELIVTQQRARAIGIEASTPMALPLSGEAAHERYLRPRRRCRKRGAFCSKGGGCGSCRHGGNPARQAQPRPAGSSCGKRGEHRRRPDAFDRRR